MTNKERDFLLDQYVSIGATPRFLDIQDHEFVIPYAYANADDPKKSFLNDLFDFVAAERKLYAQNNAVPVYAHCAMGQQRLRFIVPYHMRHEDPASGKSAAYMLGLAQNKYDRVVELSQKLSELSLDETIDVKFKQSDLKLIEKRYAQAVFKKKSESQKQAVEKLTDLIGKNARRVTFHLKNIDLNAFKTKINTFKNNHFEKYVQAGKHALSDLDINRFVLVGRCGKSFPKPRQVYDQASVAAQKLNQFFSGQVRKATNHIKNITADQLKTKAKRWTLRLMLAATLGSAVYAAANYNELKSRYQAKKEFRARDVYGNLAMFEKCRNDMRVSLAFVENFAPKAFLDGRGVPTIGYGCTYYIDENGRGNREISPVNIGDKITMEEALVQKDRYLDHRILPQIEKLVKVKMDRGTMIATVNFAYVIGPKAFKNSEYLKALNEGASKEELADCMTGFRKQKGLLSRNYFNAAELLGYISTADKLNLITEGCYNLGVEDVCVCRGGKPVKDQNDMYHFDFSKLDANLKKSCKPRRSIVNGGGHCPKVSEILPETIVQKVLKTASKGKTFLFSSHKDNLTR